MSKPFNGKVNIDIRDSTPDWTPYEAPKAPEDAPNILYIVWDDVGFGAFDIYGGLINVPNMKRIADKGLLYTQFHTTALCSPTRSCLLTGRNATSNGMAVITEGSMGFPGMSARIPPENAFVAEVLLEKGWNTYALGKWHLSPVEETSVATSKRFWPLSRGFERYYGFLGGESDQYYPDLIYDNHPVEPPSKPKEGYHLCKDLADKAIQFIRDSKVIAPEKPWLMYYAPGCAHAPHHVPKEWADKYKGKFDMGYENCREIILDNQKKMGIMPENTQLPPLNPYAETKSPDGKPWPILDTVRPWDSLSEDEKKLFRRMAEVYAGYISYNDAQIGRILDYLEASGQLDNTIIIAVSDNGASAEGGPNGSVNENKFFNGIPDNIEENMKYLDALGSENTYNHYCSGWAMAFDTPFKLWKRYASFEGGVADACIIAWPKGIKSKGEVRHQYLHAIDIVPTLYDCLGFEPPTVIKGYTQNPLEGVSFKHTFDDPNAQTAKETQFSVMAGTRGIWHKGWFACTPHPALADWHNFSKDKWELYNLEEDRNQIVNLADKYPDKLEELKGLWYFEAGKYHGLPLLEVTAVEALAAPRPQPSKPRQRYIYYPDCAEVPESVAVNIRGRSYNIAVEVDIQKEEAEGVLFAHGGRFGGHTLYIKDGKLNYVYNWLGEKQQKLTSSTNIPTGKCILGVRFRKEGQEGTSAAGMAALYINNEKVAEAKIQTQPGNFSLTGEGLNVGQDGGQPVSGDYESPFEFKGGVIKQVTVDVSGEPFRDLEKELQGMLARD
jgi:arylsulfatase A-like enzyme